MKWNRILTAAIATLGIWSAVYAADNEPAAALKEGTAASPASELKTQAEKLGYAIGVQIGRQLRSDGIEVNVEQVAKAVRTVLEGGTTALTPEEANAVIQQMNRFVAARQGEIAARNLAEAQKFLAENATKEGVQTRPSGLQYKVFEEGDGPSPARDDIVEVQYRGTLLSGGEFANSAHRGGPEQAQIKNMIPGWQEAMQLMKEGAKWQLFLPPNLAFGEMGNQLSLIPPNAVLIYEVELLKVIKTPPAGAEMKEKTE